MDWHDPTLWVAVGFVVLVAGAYRPGRRAILGMLDARIDAIRADLDEAADLRRQAEQHLAEYQRKQREALKNAESHIEHAREDAERQALEEQERFEAVMRRRERAAMDKIAQAEAEALREVQALSVEAAVAATRHLIAGHLDGGRQERLVDEAIRELGARLQ